MCQYTNHMKQDVTTQGPILECSSAGVVTFNIKHHLVIDGSKQGSSPIDGFSSIYCEGDNANWVKHTDTAGDTYYECYNYTDISAERIGQYGALLYN